MKTGFDIMRLPGFSLAGLLLLLSATTVPARAADLPTMPPPVAMPAAPAPMPVASMPAPATEPMPILPAAGAAMPTAMTAPALPMNAGGSSGGPANGKESMAALENNVTDQAKAAVKRFNTSTNDVNLDDLNTARMAIAKIDALIDIEKHLAELDKIRAEREGKGSLASAIPASALALPGGMAMPHNEMAAMPVAMSRTEIAMPAAKRVAAHKPETETSPGEETGSVNASGSGNNGISINRITGANGNYMAVVKAGGQDKTVRIGDHLPDGSAVVNITPTSVSLMRNNAVRQIRVDGIEVVNGHSY